MRSELYITRNFACRENLFNEIMTIQESYNNWAREYDTNRNRTRDIEARALRELLAGISIDACLEIGCGTGKNTQWLVTRASHIDAVDFSEEMLKLAKVKISSGHAAFRHADITHDWIFATQQYDLITFSLVLEHIEHLEHIFGKVSDVITRGGYLYIGELHPFKQYTGSKARFETAEGSHALTCFNHHVSDFIIPAKKFGFELVDLAEYFDDDDRSSIPRLLAILMRKA